MKLMYVSPLFLDGNGEITLTISQLAELGCDESVIASWEAFLAEIGEMDWPTGFNVNDPSTYDDFDFVLNDPDTWMNPFAYVE